MTPKIFIGTSGWIYPHWRGTVYPSSLPQKKWLEEYIKNFNSVEVNSTFYRLPTEKTVEGWFKKVEGKNFVYSLKMWRLITHRKRLIKVEDHVKNFLNLMERLRDKLGVILIQFPPNLKANPELIHSFTEILPKKFFYAFEFRNKTWFENQDVLEILNKKNFSMVVYHHPFISCPLEQIGGFLYLRFHGYKDLYSGYYPMKMLTVYAKFSIHYLRKGLPLFAYFNNDYLGNAFFNAKEFRELIENLKNQI